LGLNLSFTLNTVLRCEELLLANASTSKISDKVQRRGSGDAELMAGEGPEFLNLIVS
jgi:hypothetical protein